MSDKLDLSNMELEIPNDIGVPELDPDAMGGEMSTPQPGIYSLLPFWPKSKKSETYFSLGTKEDPTAPVLSTILSFKINGADSPIEEESAWMNRIVFNKYISTKPFGGQSTSQITDMLKSAGYDVAPIKEAGGLTFARNCILECVLQQKPVWAYVSYDWQASSSRPDPDDPSKTLYIKHGKENGMDTVPRGLKGLAKDVNGFYPTTRPYTHVWPDGMKEDVELHARLTISRFVLPPA